MNAPIASVVVPAHNEERTIGRLLDALVDPTRPLDIVVVCNGCTDRTAVAASRPGVRVIDIEQPSKRLALAAGDAAASAFPRVFVDADVVIDAASVQRLAIAVRSPTGVLASAPRRVQPMAGVSRPVRWYYEFWECLPNVQAGLFGRGVVALSEAGNARVQALGPTMADDLVASEAFTSAERRVVDDAVVVVNPPRTTADLVRRRSRIIRGNREADTASLRGSSAQTGIGTLVRVVRRDPRLILRLPFFLGLTMAARARTAFIARRGKPADWERDESSRT